MSGLAQVGPPVQVEAGLDVAAAAATSAELVPTGSAAQQQETGKSLALHVADLLLPVAVALWAVGVSRTNISALGLYGLPPILPVVFYLGVALLVISAVIELMGPQTSAWRMSIHAAVLTVMLYGTAPLVYAAGRYSWLYKTIGVVQYVNAHGQLNRSIDIYQNWPGFFAFTAWFDKLAGVASPLSYAKWAQLVFELAALPLLYLIYDALRLTKRQRWIALLLFPASNWIGQDYYSPQALGTVLSLGIMAIVMRWMYVRQPGPRRRFGGRARRARGGIAVAVSGPAALPSSGRPTVPRELPAAEPAGRRRARSGLAESDDSAGSQIARLIDAHRGLSDQPAPSADASPSDRFPGQSAATPSEYQLGGYQVSGYQPGQYQVGERQADEPLAGQHVPREQVPGEYQLTAPPAPSEADSQAAEADQAYPDGREASPRLRLGYCAVVALLFFALTFTHELSPYMLVAQVFALAFFRMLRPRWLPIMLMAIAIAYLIPRFSYVNSHYGLLHSLGNLFNNATPPALTGGSVAPSQRLIERSAELLSLGVWFMALLGAWLRRRSGKFIFALLLLAFAPAAMLALQAYGHEGILRVYLFSLPWSAALAAMVVSPAADPDEALGASPAATTRSAALIRRVADPIGRLVSAMLRPVKFVLRPVTWVVGRDAVRALLVLGVCLTLFFPAFFGDDSFNFMSQPEVAIVTSFLQTAPVGRIYIPIDNAPLADTSKYDLFPRTQIIGDLIPNGLLKPNIAKLIAQDEHDRSGLKVPAYVVITPSMVAYNNQYELTPPKNFAMLRAALASSGQWKLLINEAGVTIYELVPRAA